MLVTCSYGALASESVGIFERPVSGIGRGILLTKRLAVVRSLNTFRKYTYIQKSVVVHADRGCRR